jgi:tetratricopeptide (TPR) repeat protein
MARRRVNTRFVSILLLILFAAGTAIYMAQKLLIHEHADRYVGMGTQAAHDGKWPDAVADFTRAAGLSPSDADIQMKLGESLHHLAAIDPERYAQERQAYARALDINPNYLPALRALIAWYESAVSGAGVADSNAAASLYGELARYARRAHELAPTDASLAPLSDEIIVRQWRAGLETDQDQVDKAIANLQALAVQYPTDAQIIFEISQAKIYRGHLAALQSTSERLQPKETTDAYADAVQTFQKVLSGGGGVPSQDNNASMHYQFARVLEFLSVVDQSSAQAQKKDAEEAIAEADRAEALTRPADEDYGDIKEYAAALALRHGDRAKAILIYKSLPNQPRFRLDLAQVLGQSPETRVEGENIVSESLAQLHDDPTHIAGLRFAFMLELVQLQLSDYVSATDAASKQSLHDQIQSTLDRLDAAVGSQNPLDLRRVEFTFQIYSGQQVAAIPNISRLIADNPAAAKDYRILMLLMRAYEETGQAGRALSVLSDIQKKNIAPYDVTAKKEYVRLLLRESPEQASGPLEDLDRIDEGDPELIQFHIELLRSDPTKNADQIRQYYNQLQEASSPQIAVKARVATALQDWPEASRLLTLYVAQNPKDAVAYADLARLQAMQGKKDDALKTATQGLSTNPDNIMLKLLIPAIKGEDPSVIQNLEEDFARQNPDHLAGELELSQIAGDRGDTQGQETHLKAAEKLSPDSPKLWSALFQFYVRSGRYEEAEAYLPRLSDANFDLTKGELLRLQLAEARGDWPAAQDIAQQLTQDYSEFATSWQALGDVLLEQGQYDEAITQYTVALNKQSSKPGPYVGMARCLEALHKSADALKYINAGLSKSPGDPTLRELLLTYQLSHGNPQDAINEVQEEIHRTPNSPQLYGALADTYLRYAKILQANKQQDDASKVVTTSVKMLQDALARWPDEPLLYVVLEETMLAVNQPTEAEKVLQTWASRNLWKSRPDPYEKLADFYQRVGRPDAAENALRTALARSNYQVNLQIAMAQLLAMHKKTDEALQLLRATNTDKTEVRREIVLELLKANRFDDAQAELQTDITQHPSDSAVLLTIWAKALLERRQFAAAADKANQALAINANNADARYCRARARLLMQPPDPAAALSDLLLVRKAAPNNPEIRLNLADAYLEMNKNDEAANELRAGLQSDPNNKPVRMKLAQIYLTGEHPQWTEVTRLMQEVDGTPPFDTDADIFSAESTALAGMKDLPGALEKSRKAVSLAPENPDLLRNQLKLLQATEDYQGVLAQVSALPDKFKNTSWALLARCVAEKRLGNSDTALADLNSALQSAAAANDSITFAQIGHTIAQEFGHDQAIASVGPFANDHLSAKLTLIELYHAKGDDTRAVALMDGVWTGIDRLSQADQIVVCQSAAVLYQTTKPTPLVDKSYDAYRYFLKLQPDNIEALNNVACLLADDYSPPRATEGLSYAQKAADEMTRLGRNDTHVLDTEGWLLILQGSIAQGVDVLNQVVQTNPYPEACFHLGEGYLRMEYADQAKQQAELGLSLMDKASNPDPNLRAKLKELDNRSEELAKSKQQAQVP